MRLKIASALILGSMLSACAGGMGGDEYRVAGPVAPPSKPVPQVYVPEVVSASDFLAAAGTNTVFFDTDKSVLTPQARDTLTRQLAWLVTHRDVDITVEGHADERASDSHNLGLGMRRAEAVKAFFVAGGIRDERIRSVSFGEDSPVIDEHGDIQINRRAVTVIAE